MRDAECNSFLSILTNTHLSIVLYLFYLWTIDKNKPYTNDLGTQCTPPGIRGIKSQDLKPKFLP